MQKVNEGKPACFWCPMCGSLKLKFDGDVPGAISRPKIVPRSQGLVNYVGDLLKGDAKGECILAALRECFAFDPFI